MAGLGASADKGTHGHDGQRPAEVRRVVEHAAALVQGVKDEAQLAVVEIKDRLFQVAHAAVHELCAARRGPRAEVGLLHERCAKAPVDTRWLEGAAPGLPPASGARAWE